MVSKTIFLALYNMSDKRHFTVVEGKKEHGLFVGRNPSSVARKVVSKLSKAGKKVVFELREITQGSKKKVYGPYEGQKKKLKEPRKVGDRVYKYESVVKKIEKKGGTNDYFNSPEDHTLVFNFYPEGFESVGSGVELKYEIKKTKQENGTSFYQLVPITRKGMNIAPVPLPADQFIDALYTLVVKQTYNRLSPYLNNNSKQRAYSYLEKDKTNLLTEIINAINKKENPIFGKGVWGGLKDKLKEEYNRRIRS